jgi:hypothetical protein
MSFSCCLRRGYDGQSELGGALGDLADDALAVALRKVVLALVGVFLAFGQQGVDEDKTNA